MPESRPSAVQPESRCSPSICVKPGGQDLNPQRSRVNIGVSSRRRMWGWRFRCNESPTSACGLFVATIVIVGSPDPKISNPCSGLGSVPAMDVRGTDDDNVILYSRYG